MADTLLTHPCNPCETTWLKNSMPSYIPRNEAEQNDVERFDAELCSCSDSENRDVVNDVKELQNRFHAKELYYIPFQADRSAADPTLQVELLDVELWTKFSILVNEMVVTKEGRRLFPGFRVKLFNLDPNEKYCVFADIVRIDDNRYKYQNSIWKVAGSADGNIPRRFYLHPKSPADGKTWMESVVSFHKLKITNSLRNSRDEKIFVPSMHRYQPRVHVVRSGQTESYKDAPFSTFAFPETVFISVTAYQNTRVTELKVQHNPFARGYRPNGGKTKSFARVSHLSQLAAVPNNYQQHQGKLCFREARRQLQEKKFAWPSQTASFESQNARCHSSDDRVMVTKEPSYYTSQFLASTRMYNVPQEVRSRSEKLKVLSSISEMQFKSEYPHSTDSMPFGSSRSSPQSNSFSIDSSPNEPRNFDSLNNLSDAPATVPSSEKVESSSCTKALSPSAYPRGNGTAVVSRLNNEATMLNLHPFSYNCQPTAFYHHSFYSNVQPNGWNPQQSCRFQGQVFNHISSNYRESELRTCPYKSLEESCSPNESVQKAQGVAEASSSCKKMRGSSSNFADRGYLSISSCTLDQVANSVQTHETEMGQRSEPNSNYNDKQEQ